MESAIRSVTDLPSVNVDSLGLALMLPHIHEHASLR